MALTRVSFLYTSVYSCTAQACTGVADTFATAVFIKNYEANLFKRHLTTLSTAEIV
jgi:hypothetical protein